MDLLSGSSEEVLILKKRSKKSIKQNYFDIAEEDAVKDFILATTSEDRNKIYNERLKAPLDKMISSIIRRYKLYRKGMDFEEIHNDTHSFLLTKVDKFKPSRNKKAYSYFGTICKNYLMGQIIKDQKELNRMISYEDVSSTLEDRPDMVYYIGEKSVEPVDVISEYSEKLKTYIDTANLSDNEKKLGLALIDLFDNYENIFTGNHNNKFNKNLVLLSLREMTNLTTKEIRISIKKFRKLYVVIQNKLKNI